MWVANSQCQRQGVPFFFKQWGGVRKKQNGRLLAGRTWDEMPLSGAAASAWPQTALQSADRLHPDQP